MDYSADTAGSFVHKILPGRLREKYSIMQVHYIVEAMMEYLDIANGDPENFDEMFSYVIDDFGALDGESVKLTITDLKAISKGFDKYLDALDNEDDDEDDDKKRKKSMSPKAFAKVLNKVLSELGVEQIEAGKLYTYPPDFVNAPPKSTLPIREL